MSETMRNNSWSQTSEQSPDTYGSTEIVFSTGRKEPSLFERIVNLEKQLKDNKPTIEDDIKFSAGYDNAVLIDGLADSEISASNGANPDRQTAKSPERKPRSFKHLHTPVEDPESGNEILHGEYINTEDNKFIIRTSGSGAPVMELAVGTEESDRATSLVGSELYTRQDKKYKDKVFYARISSNSAYARSVLNQFDFKLNRGERLFVKITEDFLQNLESNSVSVEADHDTDLINSYEDNLQQTEQAEIARRQADQMADIVEATPVDQPELYNTEADEDVVDEVAEAQFQAVVLEDSLEVDKPERERSKDKPSGKIALGKLAVKRTLDRFNSLSKGRKAVAGIVGTALVAVGAWGGVSAYENVIESSGESKELSNEILADPLELEVSSMSGHLDLQIPTKDGFVKAPFIDTTIDRLEEKVESNVEITPDNLSQVLKSAYPDAAEPDYLAVNKSGVEVALSSSNGKLIKDIDHKTGTVTVNLDKLDLTVNTTVSSDKKNMKFAPSIVQEGGFGDISAEDMGAYVDTLQKDESNLRDSAAKFVEGEVSNSIVTANSGQDLDAVVKSQLSKRIEEETGYSAIEFQGQYTVNVHEDDKVSVDKNSVLQGVSNLHLKDGEKGIKIVHDEDQSAEKENSK